MRCCWGRGCFDRQLHPSGVVTPPATTILPPNQNWVKKRVENPPKTCSWGFVGAVSGLSSVAAPTKCHWLWVARVMARGATEMLGQAGT